MAKKKQNKTLSYSVLDRLLGPEFDNTTTTIEGEPNALYVEKMITCVTRDLQNLLNNRKVEMHIPDAFNELKKSLVDYGVMDLTTVSARSQADQEKFRLSVQKAIEHYEPRLKRVDVNIIESPSETSLIFHFNISAVLMIDPEPLTIRFDTVLPTDTRVFEVKGSANDG